MFIIMTMLACAIDQDNLPYFTLVSDTVGVI
jgi:hypothetical protein